MHRNVIFTFGLIVYFLVVTVALYQFDASLFTSAIVLLGIPTFFLARLSAAPPVMLVTVGCFAAGVALLLEWSAYSYGLWYIANTTGIELLGLISIEMLVVVICKILFLVLFYELLFDDGEYSTSNARNRLVEFGLFAVGTIMLLGVYYLFFDTLDAPTAYYWITIVLLMASLSMLAVKQALTVRLFDKIATYVLVAAVPLLCLEFLAVANGYKVIVSMLHPIVLPLVNVSLPLGEVLLALSMPIFVVAVYELYLDDRG
jgi:hypothetical protein